MTQIDELKKWLNESIYHYEAIMQLGKTLPSDRNYMDAFNSVKTKIAEIEAKTLPQPDVICSGFKSAWLRHFRTNVT